jgi:hypothetical protein
MDFTDYDGKPCVAHGVATGSIPFELHRLGVAFSRLEGAGRTHVVAHAFRYMTIVLAGPEAETRQRKWSRCATALGGGMDDRNICRQISDWLGDNESLYEAADLEARRFVRDPAMWEAINALADLLQERGRVRPHDKGVRAITKPIERLAELNMASR